MIRAGDSHTAQRKARDDAQEEGWENVQIAAVDGPFFEVTTGGVIETPDDKEGNQ